MQAFSAAPLAAVRTVAVQRALAGARDRSEFADFVFLEMWERSPIPGVAAALRVNQIRRANPELAAEIRAELTRGRPLTQEERAALAVR
jgi:hypothetical protein